MAHHKFDVENNRIHDSLKNNNTREENDLFLLTIEIKNKFEKIRYIFNKINEIDNITEGVTRNLKRTMAAPKSCPTRLTTTIPVAISSLRVQCDPI